ncbi:DeoR/GlpR family DNA-binding transcription regulator [Bacteroidota bacterium]
MLKVERQSFILEELRLHERVESSCLCNELKVSDDTIRRDLADLERKGHLKKVHGGAVSLTYIPNFTRREVDEIQLKRIVAKKALGLIRENSIIIIDAGTTNLQLVNILPLNVHLTVITNSIPAASKLCDYENIDSIFLGGEILKNGQATVGKTIIESLINIHADLCFLGMASIDLNAGITEANKQETGIKHAFIEASNKVVTLLISKKLGTVQSYKVCDINCLTTMVTELCPSDERLVPYAAEGVEII